MDPVALAAHGESLWHRLGLAALGIGWVEDGEVARRTQPSSPVFLGALSLRAGVPAARLAQAVGPLAGDLAVRDAGATEDLGPFGFVLQGREPWMLRPPGPVAAAPAPPALEVAPCRTPAEVELFERTSAEGFTGSTATLTPGAIHPAAASLRVPGLTLLLARLDGHPLYRTLGFHDVGPTALWWRPAHRAT
jgi:hypothetical protein